MSYMNDETWVSTQKLQLRICTVDIHAILVCQELSKDQGPKAWTYGEIEYSGVKILQQELGVDGNGLIFYDLGSGLGRMVFQVFFEWRARKAIGVELSEHRHNRAVRALGNMQAEVEAEKMDTERCLEFRNENLLASDISDATVVYLACTCWDADFMEQVLEKQQEECAELQWLVSTEPLVEVRQ